jgi:hypothetical protein
MFRKTDPATLLEQAMGTMNAYDTAIPRAATLPVKLSPVTPVPGQQELFDKGKPEGYKPFNRLQAILDFAENECRYVYINFAHDYAEPGYSLDNEKGCIFLSNWNTEHYWRWEWVHAGRSGAHYWDRVEYENDIMPRVARILERMGYNIEWEDEWLVCDCGKAFRTSPDSYSWRMYGYIGDGDYACGDCVKDDPDEYLESLQGSCSRAISIKGIDPEDHGYVNLMWDENGSTDSKETGWHPGQTADPAEIADALHRAGCDDFVFQIDYTSQFYSGWSVWVPKSSIGIDDDADWDTTYSLISNYREGIIGIS